ncbi:MAG: M14 family metallopeptidase, partial [Bacteroidota bacterium]
MFRTVLHYILTSLFLPSLIYAQTSLVLIEMKGVEEPELNKALSLFGDQRGKAFASYLQQNALVVATSAEARVLSERGLEFTVILEDTSRRILFKRALYGSAMKLSSFYHTYDQILGEADALIETHPDLITKFAIGKTTQEDRTIYAIRISNDVAFRQDKPAILFDGCHHADEIMGAEICTALMNELVTKYGSDPRITDWVDSYEILIVPVVNVDGHHVVTSGIDPRWRKNTHDTNGNGVLYEYPEGVDLNRNYDFNWAHGGSSDPMSVRYRGPHPFSEAENRAMRGLAEEYRFILSLTYHSQGEVVYYPWMWRGRKAPEDKLLTELANGLGSSIRTMAGDTTYKAEYGAGTVGQSYPWLYGRYGTFDFVVETGKGAHIFPDSDAARIIESNLEGIRYILDQGNGPGLTGHVTDAHTGKALGAQIWLPDIDMEDVERRTSLERTGRFWRLLSPGKHR